jgi:hypothetical protein
MICSGASDDTSNTARAGGSLSDTSHEAGCHPSKSPGWMRVCVSYSRVRNLTYLLVGSSDYKNSSSNFIESIRINNEKPYINKARLDVLE